MARYYLELALAAGKLEGPPDPGSALAASQLAEDLLARSRAFRHACPQGHADMLFRLARFQELRGRPRRAEEFHAERVDTLKAAVGERDPACIAAMGERGRLLRDCGRYADAEALLRQAIALSRAAGDRALVPRVCATTELAMVYLYLRDLAKALPLGQDGVALARKVVGEDNPLFAAAVDTLGLVHQAKGNYAAAEPLHQRAFEIRRKILGDTRPDCGKSLDNLASLYLGLGDYAKAEPLYQRALDIRRKALGDAHPDCAETLNNLAILYREKGEYAQAEPLYQQALDIFRKALGESHPGFATTLNGLALLYVLMGDRAKAEPLYRQAVEIHRKALGESHPDYAVSLHNLAQLYHAGGDPARAEPLYQQALQIVRHALGESNPAYAPILSNLATLYADTGEHGKAAALFAQVLPLLRTSLGGDHPNVATVLNQLGTLYYTTGRFAEARRVFEQSLDLRRRTVGEAHVLYAETLANLARTFYAMGDSVGAEPLLAHAMRLQQDHLRLAFSAQTEQQQLLMAETNRGIVRGILDSYLSVALSLNRGEQAYRYVLAWKGMVFVRQRDLRLLRDQPELRPLFAELQSTTSRLVTLSLAAPAPAERDAWRRALAELTDRKERLEVALGHKSAGYRRLRDERRLAPEQLQDALPPDAALLDLFEFTRTARPTAAGGKWSVERHLAGFVVRRGRPVAAVDLGPTEPVELAVEAWRDQVASSRGAAEDSAAGPELRKRVWLPLEPHLDGARLVLVSPDGALARLPLPALPGKTPGTYLIEERPIAVVPVPQMLPELLARREARPEQAQGMLLVGGVDFEGNPGSPALTQAAPGAQLPPEAATRSHDAARGDRSLSLKALPGSAKEVQAIGELFRAMQKAPADSLQGDKATEEAFRANAPGRRYLHVATHGFFAPPQVRSALQAAQSSPSSAPASPPGRSPAPGSGPAAAFHPGLLSGIALAGANRGGKEPAGGAPRDDGILTALEVADLDLRAADLVVLSACETGLGKIAGGEGVLGLQRAFQVAGARTVIASLWKVDDQSTMALMARFYDGLWRKGLSKLDALRQAQLGLLNAPPEGATPGGGRRARPWLWAAWVLSGDPGGEPAPGIESLQREPRE